ncbi:MAG: polymerase sigma-70 factor, subfamily [Candidatus Peribacteria bacterium]|nr:polymerase sigma-70 factor, subfamily [Candidatus Peribacteria bacterium]
MIQQPLEESDIRTLIASAQQGDTDAFGQVYDHYFPSVYRYTAFRAPAELVEDIVADIFVKAWEKLHQYKVQKDISFGAWVFRIARHTVIDTYRTQRNFEEVSEELPDNDIFNKPDTRIHSQDTVRIVRQAMMELPKRYREILILSYIAELPHHEVARVLRLTEGAVRILKFRALRKLEALLPPDMRRQSSASSA